MRTFQGTFRASPDYSMCYWPEINDMAAEIRRTRSCIGRSVGCAGGIANAARNCPVRKDKPLAPKP
jgi:hypothetical protein